MMIFVDPTRSETCHCWSDLDLQELVEFAWKLGIDGHSIQKPPMARWLHVDLTREQRSRALRLGAIGTDQYGSLEFRAQQEGDDSTLKAIEQSRDYKSKVWR
jgi:hypothetical protein